MANETIVETAQNNIEAAPTQANTDTETLINKAVDAGAPVTETDTAPKTETLIDEKPVTDAPVNELVGAPEAYEDLNFGEGAEINEKALGEFKELAKSMNLSQSGVQKLADFQSSLMKEQSEQVTASYDKMSNDWKAETIKQLGPEYQKDIAIAGKAIDRLGSPELRDLLNNSKLGNNPDMVQFLVKVGKSISEDTPPQGSSKAPKSTEPDEFDFYPTMKKQK
jgi:hypothetical protein